MPIEEASDDVTYTTRAGKTYPAGLFSFNCRHTIVPYESGMVVETIPDEVIEERRSAEEKQRKMERAIRREREKAAIYGTIGKQGGDKEVKKLSARHRRRAAQMRREYETFSKEHELAYYPERTSSVKGEDIYSRTAGKTDKALTKNEESGIIITGGVEDNFSRKAQITEYTDDLAKTNPNYSTKEFKWLNNCQRCVPTYEMRRRGYNVTAKPQPRSRTDLTKDILTMRPWEAWNNPKLIPFRSKEDIEGAMLKMGDGARIQIKICFKSGLGHTFVAEQLKGKTIFVDPQTGNLDCRNYFEKQKSGAIWIDNVFWRVDNLRPSNLIQDCCS